MSTKIIYNSNVIASVEAGQKVTLACKGKVMEGNIVVEVESAIMFAVSQHGTLYATYTVPDGTTWKEFIDEQAPSFNYGASRYYLRYYGEGSAIYYADETGFELGSMYKNYNYADLYGENVDANEQIIANHNYAII